MWKKWSCLFLMIPMIFCGCSDVKNQQKAMEKVQESLNQSFCTTAKLMYQGLEAEMKLYKKPMNCAVVTFETPESLKGMKMTFYPDKVTLNYQDLSFDFTADSLPGKAASKMILSAINTAMHKQGITVEQKDHALIVRGQIEQGEFLLTLDAQSGNILKLSIPESQLELEVLNFQILE